MTNSGGFSFFSRITLQQHVVQESEPNSNEHVQIVARAGSANLMDTKTASHQPSQIGCMIHTAGLAWHHLMLEHMSKEGLVQYGWKTICCVVLCIY